MKEIITVTLFVLLTIQGMAQEFKMDTLYSDEGIIEGYGKVKDGKRIGSWHFNLQQKIDYFKWNYLENNRIISRQYFNEKLTALYEAKIKDSLLVKDGVYLEYFKGGLSLNATFSKGKLNGNYIEYYPSQEVKKHLFYKDGVVQGKVVYYYEDGMLMKEGEYAEIGKAKVWHQYYPNGVLKSEGSYLIIEIPDEKMSEAMSEISEEFVDTWVTLNSLEVKDGVWKHYSKTGEIIKEVAYDKGVIVKTENE
jgi:antitoxin component YwqK of YwqJK toxin-antitoxin module